jgi:hypothetical protein
LPDKSLEDVIQGTKTIYQAISSWPHQPNQNA